MTAAGRCLCSGRSSRSRFFLYDRSSSGGGDGVRYNRCSGNRFLDNGLCRNRFLGNRLSSNWFLDNGLCGNRFLGNRFLGNGLSGNWFCGNRLSGNRFSGNRDLGNGLSSNGLSSNGLSGNGLSGNRDLGNGLSSNGGRRNRFIDRRLLDSFHLLHIGAIVDDNSLEGKERLVDSIAQGCIWGKANLGV